MPNAPESVRTGIVLAAGRGSRMGARAASGPKCLVELGGRTLLEWQMASLSAAGIQRIVVVGGHAADWLVGPFEKIMNERWTETNSVRSLCSAEAVLASEPCIVSYGDIVYHRNHVGALLESPNDIAITYDEWWTSLWAERFADPLSDAETFSHENGRLLAIGARPTSMSDVHGQFMGLLKFTPRGWSQVRGHLEGLSGAEVDRLDTTTLLSSLLRRGVEIGAVPVRGRWCEADTADDLALYARRIAASDRGEGVWSHDWRAE